jgi:hypothetical protein
MMMMVKARRKWQLVDIYLIPDEMLLTPSSSSAAAAAAAAAIIVRFLWEKVF